jgi:hypothetical protein
MNDDDDDNNVLARALPELTRFSIKDLKRDTAGVLDLALDRMLAEDATTTSASAGFQSRI